MTVDADADLVEIASSASFEATLARVVEMIQGAGLEIFARIDHAENARKAGLEMPPTVVLIYGHGKGGTPLMLAAPNVALDLPLRVLVREAAPGAVIAYHPIAPTLLRAGMAEDLAHRLDGAQRLLGAAVQS